MTASAVATGSPPPPIETPARRAEAVGPPEHRIDIDRQKGFLGKVVTPTARAPSVTA